MELDVDRPAVGRQIEIVDADVADRPLEPGGAPSRADSYGLGQFTTRITNPIEQNLQLLRPSVDIDVDAFNLAGTVIRRRHVMPAAQGNRMLGDDVSGIIHPAPGHEVEPYLAFLQQQAVTRTSRDLQRRPSRDNWAVWSR